MSVSRRSFSVLIDVGLPPVVVMLVLTGAVSGCGAAPPRVDPFPARPASLNVDTLDPCTALTGSQRAALRLGAGRSGTAQGGSSRVCTWLGDGDVGYNLQTLQRDASEAIGADQTARVVDVAGFGAVQSSPPAPGTGLPFCQLVLDVAEGRSLRVQGQVDPTGSGAAGRTAEDVCRDTRQVAIEILSTLATADDS